MHTVLSRLNRSGPDVHEQHQGEDNKIYLEYYYEEVSDADEEEGECYARFTDEKREITFVKLDACGPTVTNSLEYNQIENASKSLKTLECQTIRGEKLRERFELSTIEDDYTPINGKNGENEYEYIDVNESKRKCRKEINDTNNTQQQKERWRIISIFLTRIKNLIEDDVSKLEKE